MFIPDTPPQVTKAQRNKGFGAELSKSLQSRGKHLLFVPGTMGFVYTIHRMKNFIVSAGVLEKLRDKHGVSVREVEQCFENKCGMYLEDDREDNRTDPVTLAFIAPTNQGRLLKVAFIFLDGNVHIKTAFEPDADDIAFYERNGK
jgi:uncharacterized DUF497 family protein